MTTDESADRQLDDLLQRSYETLRRPNPLERQAVLNGLLRVPRNDAEATRRPSRLRLASISTVVVISLVAAVFLLRWAPSDGAAYGIDGLPERLHQVQSFSLRGWRWTRDSSGPNKPPLRVPFELLVKRPSMFRHSVTSISVQKGRTEIRQHLHLCDGKQEWFADETGKPLFFLRSLSPLEARLKTESLAQITAVTAVLGPFGAPYQKIGKDNANGRPCDLYEGRIQNGSRTTATKVWIDPQNGLPVRVVRDELAADGKLSDEMELTEITVNAPLPDDQFRLQRPDAEKPSGRDELHDGKEPPPLDASPVSSGSNGNSKLEAWYALRISDSAALVIWRRSPPATHADGSPDWLSDMTITLSDPSGTRSVRHASLDQSTSADRWSWSLVVPADGKPIGPSAINLTLKARRGQTSLVFLALWFNDEELEQILVAARRATLGQVSEPMSLPDLRAQALALSGSKGSK